MNPSLFKMAFGVSVVALAQTTYAQTATFPQTGSFQLASVDGTTVNTCLGRASNTQGSLSSGSCADLDSMAWKAGATYGEYVQLVAENGLCLESGDGTDISYLDACKEVQGQYWKLREVYTGVYFLTSLYRDSAGECLTTAAQFIGAAGMADCNGADPKIWRFQDPSGRTASAAAAQSAGSQSQGVAGSTLAANAALAAQPTSSAGANSGAAGGGTKAASQTQSKPAAQATNSQNIVGQILAAAVLQQLLAGLQGRQPANALTGNDINQILALHNGARARHHVPNLFWDAGLAADAQAQANSCDFRKQNTPGIGENLAYWGVTNGLVPQQSVAELVNGWYAESASYDYFGLSTVNFHPGGPDNVSNFTQMVWGDTATIGCGVSACYGRSLVGMNELLVCRYDIKGNPDLGDAYPPGRGTALASLVDVQKVYDSNVQLP